MPVAQDLGGPLALSGVGAFLVSPPSDARARPLLSAPHPVASPPATGDSLSCDTGPGSYCLNGSFSPPSAPLPCPPFILSPSAPTFYPSSSRRLPVQALCPSSCFYHPLVPAVSDASLASSSTATSHSPPTVQSLPLPVVTCQPPPPPEPPDPLPPPDQPDPPLYQMCFPPRYSSHPHQLQSCNAMRVKLVRKVLM